MLIYNKQNKRKSFGNKGFSIPEMIVALLLFSMVMVVSVGAVLSVTAANRKTFALSTINNSLVYALDSMIKDIRTGTNYDCGVVDSTKNCPLLKGAGTPQNSVHFTNDLGQATGYRLNGNVIEKLVSGSYLAITPAEVRVSKLDFYVDGVGGGSDNKQPVVNIVVFAEIYYKGQRVANFDVETMAIQRKIENNE
jgi:prepilin-type N-terminal cleavage/methylation domain-containing protein